MSDQPGTCSHCGKQQSVSRIEINQSGVVQELQLCPSCLKILFSDMDKFLSPAPASAPCPACGSGWDEIKKARRLGCPDCWSHFSAEIDALRDKKGTQPAYRGKVPARLGRVGAETAERDSLRQQLHQAVSAEEYEKAAQLRDRLKQLEGQA